jgi:hypothetical protein
MDPQLDATAGSRCQTAVATVKFSGVLVIKRYTEAVIVPVSAGCCVSGVVGVVSTPIPEVSCILGGLDADRPPGFVRNFEEVQASD